MMGGCAPAVRANADASRLRFVGSQATQATWSFRVDDHAQNAELLVDGRPRATGCARAGRELRCELFGLWPGGHVVELRLPGALLRRSVLVGKPWPERPMLVRARSAEEAALAADAGADGVIFDAAGRSAPDLSDLVDAAHTRGARAVIAFGSGGGGSGSGSGGGGGGAHGLDAGDAIERASADALLGAAVPPDVARRFPEARTLELDADASFALALAAVNDDEAGPRAIADVMNARGVVDAHPPPDAPASRGAEQAALALAAPRGAIVDAAAFPLLRARKRHAALRAGERVINLWERLGHLVVALRAPKDEVLVVVNSSREPWIYKPDLAAPLDLLGGRVGPDGVRIAAGDAALLVTTPAPDKTRF
jgi:hypothetical protein